MSPLRSPSARSARRRERIAGSALLLLAAGCASSTGSRASHVDGAAPLGPLALESPAPYAAVPLASLDDEPERPEGVDGVLHDLTHGEVYVKFRTRYEDVNMEGFSKEAHALTLRSLLGYRTKPVAGFTAVLEVEDVSHYNDHYNSTVNGNTDRPVVADPDGTEVNQVYIERKLGENVIVRGGRQRIIHGNARYMGNVGWRQNEQTQDGLAVEGQIGENVAVKYAWIDNTNRIFGEDHPMGDARQRSHAMHATGKVSENNSVTGYWYYLDFDQSSGMAGLSTQTLGGRYDGKLDVGDEQTVAYALEAAKQKDAGHNPASVDSNYFRGEATGAMGPLSVTVGREVLQGSRSGTDRFTTPLATLHAFNGWADVFLATPGTGLVDDFLTVAHKLGKDHKISGTYHDFTSEATARDYGWEFDIVLAGKATETSNYGVKFADYHAQDFGVNVRKTWVWWQFGT